MRRLCVVLLLTIVPNLALAGKTAKSRFGALSIENSEDGMTHTLLLQGTEIYESAGEGMELVTVLHGKSRDYVVLATYAGGSGCPAQAVILELRSAKDVRTSAEFGSCSDLVKAHLDGEKVVVEMPDFVAHPDETDPKDLAVIEHTTKVYTWSDGKLKESQKRR